MLKLISLQAALPGGPGQLQAALDCRAAENQEREEAEGAVRETKDFRIAETFGELSGPAAGMFMFYGSFLVYGVTRYTIV